MLTRQSVSMREIRFGGAELVSFGEPECFPNQAVVILTNILDNGQHFFTHQLNS